MPRIFSLHISPWKLLLLVGDFLCYIISVIMALYLNQLTSNQVLEYLYYYKIYFILILVTYLIVLYIADTYNYLKNYREKSHYCLIVAICTLYVEEKLLDKQYVENIERAKILRESADYSGDYSKEAAQELIKNAQDFYKKATEIIKNYNGQ